MGSSMDTVDGGWLRIGPARGRRPGVLLALALALLVVAGAVVAFSDATNDSMSADSMSTDSQAQLPTAGFAGGDEAARGGPDLAVVDQDASSVGGEVASRPAASASQPVPAPGFPGSEPRIVKHAELAIEVDEPMAQAFDRVSDVARSQGGFVVSSSTSSVEEGPARAELTLRVPADRFDAARSELAEVGEVRSVRVGGEDVTAQLVDLGARLRALRAEEDALNALLGQATNVGEVLSVREQVSATRSEIEQLAAQQASLDDRASFSTLRVSLSEPGAAGTDPEPRPAAGLARSLERALHGAVAVVGGMVVVVGYAGPFLVLGLLGWGAQRLTRVRRRAT